MNSDETIRTFVDYFRERGHHRITGSSLIPPPGDRVLFTTSGMHPLSPYLLGRPHPLGRRLVNIQRCLRTTDLDEVGDPTHLTVFEMLGSWSLGDYDGSQSLRWGYHVLRDGFGIGTERMRVTVFGGNGEVGPDTRSLRTWTELDVPVTLTSSENWWSNGPTGPCGPDSEIFVWTGDTPPRGTPGRDPRWVEVWNHVMMRYRRLDDGRLQPLPRHSIDTGMGLERLLAILQGKESVYECDLFEPWMSSIPPLWDLDDTSTTRLVCDHLRSSIVVIGDRIHPSNTGRGYVLRRLIRRVLTRLWRDDPSRTLYDLPVEPIQHTLEHFDQPTDPVRVRDVLLDEQRRFDGLLRRGRPVLLRRLSRGPLGEHDYRELHDTYGLPPELVQTLLPDGPSNGVPAARAAVRHRSDHPSGGKDIHTGLHNR